LDSTRCQASPCGPVAAGHGNPPAVPAAARQTEAGDWSTATTDNDLQQRIETSRKYLQNLSIKNTKTIRPKIGW